MSNNYEWDNAIVPKFNHKKINILAAFLAFPVLIVTAVFSDVLQGPWAALPIALFLCVIVLIVVLSRLLKCSLCNSRIAVRHLKYSEEIKDGIIKAGLNVDAKSLWRGAPSYSVYTCQSCKKRAVASEDGDG